MTSDTRMPTVYLPHGGGPCFFMEWTMGPAVTTSEEPPLLFDYHGFPAHTYELTWPAPGSPELAGRVRGLLTDAGIANRAESGRGFDHGVFVPLKVALPNADIPTVALSLDTGLDPARHVAIGRALAPSRIFGDWLDMAVAAAPTERERLLTKWVSAPAARDAHPREEHLIPLMVVAGAAGDASGETIFEDEVMGARISAYGFGLAPAR